MQCKACRAELPLLKTRWLAKKDAKRVVLTMRPRADKSGVEFGIDHNSKPQGALPITWDFAESVPTADSSGGYPGGVEWAARYLEHAAAFAAGAPAPTILKDSAIREKGGGFDVVLTDPPYYDAIPYSDLMDFFYVWLRRTLLGLSPEIDAAFSEPLSPKWSHDQNDGELIDDASRFEGNKEASKRNYEEGMARAFKACHSALNADGRLVTYQTPLPAGGVQLETFLPWTLVKRGLKKQVITPLDAPQEFLSEASRAWEARAAAQDSALMRALGLAHHWQRLLDEQRATSVAEIAEAEGMDSSHVHRLMRLTLLAPDVVEKLVSQPGVTAEKVLGRPWPYGWQEQMRLLA